MGEYTVARCLRKSSAPISHLYLYCQDLGEHAGPITRERIAAPIQDDNVGIRQYRKAVFDRVQTLAKPGADRFRAGTTDSAQIGEHRPRGDVSVA
jgi:hypothetical protein